MSRGITVTLLSGLLLTACLTTGGCGRRSRDYTWYDAAGNVIPEKWKDQNGKRVPDPHPYDRYHHLWVYDSSGNLVPPAPPAGSGSRSFLFWGGSGYRTFSGSSSGSGGSSSSISRGGFGTSGSSIGG